MGTGKYGFPSFTFTGSNRPTNMTDAARNVDRTFKQNSFSISNATTFVVGGHSIRAGGLWNRNMAQDGFGIGVNYRGLYAFNGTGPETTGNAFADFLLGIVSNRARDHYTARGPLDGHSDDFAVFAQDDWRVSKDLTVFLGLRYEIVGLWHEKSDMLANWVLADGGHHVVPTAEVATKLPPGLQDLGRTLDRQPVAATRDTLINTDKNNFSPRVGFAWRLGGDDQTVLRGGFGLFHPTVAVQGVRDLLGTNEFRYYQDYRIRAHAEHLLPGDAVRRPDRLRQRGHRPEPPEPRHLPVQPDPGAASSAPTSASGVSYIGSTMRKLLTNIDYNTLLPQHRVLRPRRPGVLRAAPLRPLRHLDGHRREQGRGPAPRPPGRAATAGGGAGWRSTWPTPTPTPTAPSPTRATARWASTSTTSGTPRAIAGPTRTW